MNNGTLYKLSAFTDSPTGGNPAGVWVGDEPPGEAAMQAIAADVGFSETAFITPASGWHRQVRYFSPEAEVPFCGHATIASGVALAEHHGAGTYLFETPAGRIPVETTLDAHSATASLTSVEPSHSVADPALIGEVLRALRWSAGDIDPSIPPAVAYGGAYHLVIAAATQARLNDLDYDFALLKAIMLEAELTTVQLVWRRDSTHIHSRNPFPVGGVVEDPATGAAAAALGGYLRDAGLIEAPATLYITQGEAMGRPSNIVVDVPSEGGIVVRGTAVPLG